MEMTGIKVVGVIALLLNMGCAERGPVRPTGDEIAVRFEVLDSRLPEGRGFRAQMTLSNHSSLPLTGSGWQLYFNFGKTIASESLPAAVTATHINGDFWKLEPTGEFEPVAPGATLEIPFEAAGRLIKDSATPAGFYLVFRDESGESLSAEPISEVTIVSLADPSLEDGGLGEWLPMPTAASRYAANRELQTMAAAAVGRVVPTPVATRSGNGRIQLNASWAISYQAGLEREAAHLAGTLELLLGEAPATQVIEETGTSADVVLEIGSVAVSGKSKKTGDEAYRLSIGDDGIRIVGSDAAGVFYGIRTLEALAPLEAWQEPQATLDLEAVTIEDAPRFGYRGLHLDVARNFHSPETVKRLLEQASFYKLNRFHFHLSDDEGWRLEVTGLPELVEVGGRRGHTDDELDHLVPSYGSGPNPEDSLGSGHYSRAEMLEILAYARDRHVQVIPEIDLPGHARAAIKAMVSRTARLTAEGRQDEAGRYLLTDPLDSSEYRSVQGWNDNVVDVCRESTYRFAEIVIDEIVGIWAEADAPLEAIHIGGDEVPPGVWRKSPSCEQLIVESTEIEGPEDLAGYFMRRVSAMLQERGLATAGWEEIALAEKVWEGHQVKEPDPTLLGQGLRPYVWNNVWGWGAEDLGYKLANTGYEVVLCGATNLYFDLAYDLDPQEPGYVWAGFVDTRKPWEFVPFDVFKTATSDLMGRPLDPASFADRVRPTVEGRDRILGIQGQLWAENSKGREVLEYQAFPKLLGLAERAWAAQPAWVRVEAKEERERAQATAWNEFANRLGQRELPRLDHMLGGIAYRLPPPGAVIVEGRLEANAAFPGLAIRYTTDGSSPQASSDLYSEPVEVGGDVRVATFDTRGRASRVTVVRP
jgi:hexosaminidase